VAEDEQEAGPRCLMKQLESLVRRIGQGEFLENLKNTGRNLLLECGYARECGRGGATPEPQTGNDQVSANADR
jgi:hypothetical protein